MTDRVALIFDRLGILDDPQAIPSADALSDTHACAALALAMEVQIYLWKAEEVAETNEIERALQLLRPPT